MGGVTDFLVGAYRSNKQGNANAAAHEQKLRDIEAAPSTKDTAPYSTYRRDANAQYEATRNGTRPVKAAPDPTPMKGDPNLPANMMGGMLEGAVKNLRKPRQEPE